MHCIDPQVDAEDLPSNMEGMEREELQCVAASYGIDFDDKADVKVDFHLSSLFAAISWIPWCKH